MPWLLEDMGGLRLFVDITPAFKHINQLHAA
jgi:hypothetical protein